MWAVGLKLCTFKIRQFVHCTVIHSLMYNAQIRLPLLPPLPFPPPILYPFSHNPQMGMLVDNFAGQQ